MALYNLFGLRQRHDVNEAVPLLLEKLSLNVLLLQYLGKSNKISKVKINTST